MSPFNRRNLFNGKELADVLIVGGGAAGISAAMWCSDLGMSSILVEAASEIGGQLLNIYNPIRNYPGTAARSGTDLRDRFVESLPAAYDGLITNSTVVSADAGSISLILSNGRRLAGKSLVIATGVRRRTLDVPGEDVFAGKGIVQSGARDAALAQGRVAAVIGGGDAAAENALLLAAHAKKVFLIHRGSSLRARRQFVERIYAEPRIELFLNTLARGFEGGDVLDRLVIANLNTNSESYLPVDIALIRIGVRPNSDLFAELLEVDSEGYIVVDANCRTSERGIYAAGDVANAMAPTISTAAGMGATAAKGVYAFLTGNLQV